MNIWLNAYSTPVGSINTGYSVLKTIYKGDKVYLVPRHSKGSHLQYSYLEALPDSRLDDIEPKGDLSLSDLMSSSAKRILDTFRSEPEHFSLYVWWSGGLDSTAILLELLEHSAFLELIQARRAYVVCDENSRKEYPKMWEDTVQYLPKVQSDLSLYLKANTCHVDGMWADELFGNYQAERYPDGGVSSSKSLEDQLPKVLAFPQVALRFLDVAKDLESVFPAETLFQRLWWLEFSLGYQDALLRPYYNGSNTFSAEATKASFYRNSKYRWFSHPSWTPWALHRQLTQRFSTYREAKQELRDYIFALSKDQDYADNKPKVFSQGSLYSRWAPGLSESFARI